jgi:hypothetical protein
MEYGGCSWIVEDEKSPGGCAHLVALDADATNGSALNLEVLRRSLATVRDFLVFDHLAFIERREARSLDR